MSPQVNAPRTRRSPSPWDDAGRLMHTRRARQRLGEGPIRRLEGGVNVSR
jgi:hypothetical protein